MDSLALATACDELPDQAQAQLHGSAAAIELVVVQEQAAGGHENVSGAEWICVCRLVNGAIVCWQADAEIAVVERVVGLCAELHGEALRDPGGFKQRHVPDVQARCAHRVAPGIRQCSNTSLNESGIGIDWSGIGSDCGRGNDITDDVGIVFVAALPRAFH